MTESGSSEERIGRFSEWYRRTPVSLEFWEGVVTDRRLIWCFVGESFRSLLLRADMGTRGRDEIANLSPAAIAAFDDRNVVVGLESLRTIRLSSGSLVRRAALTVEWSGGTRTSFALYNTSRGDDQVEFVRTLAADERLSHVDIAVE